MVLDKSRISGNKLSQYTGRKNQPIHAQALEPDPPIQNHLEFPGRLTEKKKKSVLEKSQSWTT